MWQSKIRNQWNWKAENETKSFIFEINKIVRFLFFQDLYSLFFFFFSVPSNVFIYLFFLNTVSRGFSHHNRESYSYSTDSFAVM